LRPVDIPSQSSTVTKLYDVPGEVGLRPFALLLLYYYYYYLTYKVQSGA